MTPKTTGWAALALAAAFAAGWLVGASGRAAAEQASQQAEGRGEFARARAETLDGRVSLFESNFGRAGQSFDAARLEVSRAQARLRQLGDAARAGQLEVALAQLGEARRRALALDASAQDAASEALRVIDAVAAGTPVR